MAESPPTAPQLGEIIDALKHRRIGLWALLALVLLIGFFLLLSLRKHPIREAAWDPYGAPSVGAEALYSLTLEREDIKAVPLTYNAPLVARIKSIQPVDSQKFLYQVSYFGLEKGTFNLTDYLCTPDGNRLRQPILPVHVSSHVPDSAEYVIQNPPISNHAKPPPYTALLSLSAFVWVAAGLWMFLPRGKKPAPAPPTVPRKEAVKVQTLEDLLRPLVEKAANKSISGEEKTRMEHILTQYWGALLRLDHLNSVEQLRRILDHVEAGALLRAVEQWLYQPDSEIPPAEINEILKPYLGLPITEPSNEHAEPPAKASRKP
jgi:hypothetical protein